MLTLSFAAITDGFVGMWLVLLPVLLVTVSDVAPRLLNMRQAAAYLGCSFWSVRDWVLAGLLPVVELPALRPREGERPKKTLRRVLIDRADLDAFVDRAKRKSAGSTCSAA